VDKSHLVNIHLVSDPAFQEKISTASKKTWNTNHNSPRHQGNFPSAVVERELHASLHVHQAQHSPQNPNVGGVDAVDGDDGSPPPAASAAAAAAAKERAM